MKRFPTYPLTLVFCLGTLVHLTSALIAQSAESSHSPTFVTRPYCGHATDTLSSSRDSRHDSTHSYDALRYETTLQIFTETDSISGHLRMHFRAGSQELTELMLHLEGMEISNALLDGTPAELTRSGDEATFGFPAAPVAAGDSAWLELDWQGIPVIQDGLGMFITANQVYTSSDPWGTRHWMPCFDEPFDKAEWQQSIRVSQNLSVLSNGELLQVEDHGDGTQSWHFEHNYPMSTYLASICAYPYHVVEDNWEGLPLTWMVYPNHQSQAATLFDRVPLMLESFTQLWGDYPFEKYTMAEAPIYGGLGGMEHQTCSTIGSQLIGAGGHTFEMVIAHELSHQWWGDALTPTRFDQVWLNEGWATYAEAYFAQTLEDGDPQAFQNYFAQNIRNVYLNWDVSYRPIVDPEATSFADIFSVNQYQKAASVIHMLRYYLGEAEFVQAQQNWIANNLYQTVNTEDYRLELEAASGLDLQSFFEQWLYTGGYPQWETMVEHQNDNDSTRVLLSIQQEHTVLDPFSGDVPLRLITTAGEFESAVTVSGSEAQQILRAPGDFVSLEFNRDLWMLGTENRQSVPGSPQIHLAAWQTLDETGNNNGNLEVGESAGLELTLKNEGLSLWQVHFEIATPEGWGITGNWPDAELLAWGQELVLPANTLQLTPPAGQPTEARWLDLSLSITSSNFDDVVVPLRIRVGQPLTGLCAIESFAISEQWWQPELDSLGLFHDPFEISTLQNSDREAYQNWILVSGNSGHSFSEAELESFINNEDRGWLLISGQDALSNVGSAELQNLLGLEIENPETGAVIANGAPGSPFEDLSALIIGSQGAANQDSPDAFHNFSTDWQVLLNWSISGEDAGVAALYSESRRILVFGFGLEALSAMANTSSRIQILDRSLFLLQDGWLDLPSTRHSVNPENFGIKAIWPNPLNPATQVRFQLATKGIVELAIYDLRGARVSTLIQGQVLNSGKHQFPIRASGLATGIYFLRLKSTDGSSIGRFLVLK